MPARPAKSPHFFNRESDNSVRLRIRFAEEEADLIEEAAGSTPLMTWIHDALAEVAQKEVDEHRASRPKVRPIE